MEIEQGFYVKQHIENLNEDNYYLVLEVENKRIKTVRYGGTPTDSVILDYESLTAAGYVIDVLSDKDITCITKFNTYLKNGIPSSYPVAIQYQWSDQKYTIPLKQRYWNGSNLANIPEGFYE